jgi:urease accessory protein
MTMRTHMIMRTGTATGMNEAGGALPLFVWLSPSFPVGAFAYSHGLEWAVEEGDVRDAASLAAWIDDLLRHGSGRSDAVLLCVAHDAATRADATLLAEVAELAAALAPTAERRLETVQQGGSFLTALRATWPCAALDMLSQARDGDIAYPVALGVAAAGHAIPRRLTLETFLTAFVSNLVSAALRIGVIGQTQAQGVIAGAIEAVRATAAAADGATFADLGSASVWSDICSARHETQYTRLFRS